MDEKNATIEIAVLKTKMQEVNNNIERMESSMNCSVAKLEETINMRLNAIDKKLDETSDKYAGKWVEKIIWGTIGTVSTVLIVAILNLIIQR